MSRARDLADGTFSGALVAASADLTGAVEAASFSDGTNSVGGVYLTRGSAKAWANLNGTGTIALRDSFNVSSVTDVGTGQYQFNFTSAMSNSSFSAAGLSSRDNSSDQTGLYRSHLSLFATSVLIHELSKLGFFDVALVNVTINGDLA